MPAESRVSKITSSRRKLEAWSEIRELDRRAVQIAEREGIALIEAYPKALTPPYRPSPPEPPSAPLVPKPSLFV
jgi:predicted nuclease with RNAse H fold